MTKKIFKNPKLYLYSGILTCIGIGIPFIIFAISIGVGASKFPYQYIFPCIAFIYAFLAYLVGDIKLSKYKKENDNENIPDDVNEKIWFSRYIFIIPMILTLLVFVIIWIIFLISGSWPLM